MNWFELRIKTTHEAIESISNYLFEIGAEGTVIEDPEDVVFLQNNPGKWDMLDEKLFDQEFEGVIIKGYIKQDINLIDKVSLLKDYITNLKNFSIDPGEGSVELLEVNQKNWEEEWKKNFKPIKIGNRFIISPTWEKYDLSNDEILIKMDPGLSFGTGSHETTRMCIQMLEHYQKQFDQVLDVGTGTGILSIVSAKLGAFKIKAIDLDPKSVEIAKQNIKLNAVSSKIDVIEGNLMTDIHQRYNIIVANLFAELINEMSENVHSFLEDDGVFITTGILDTKEKLVVKQYENLGFYLNERMQIGEWVCLAFLKRGKKDA